MMRRLIIIVVIIVLLVLAYIYGMGDVFTLQ